MEECHLGHFYKGDGDCILWPRLTSRVFWFLTKKSVHFLIISWKDAGIKLKLCDLMWSRSWRRECSCHVNNEWPVAWMRKCVINLLKCNAEVLILILKSDKSHIFNIYMYIYIFVFSCNNYHDYAKKKSPYNLCCGLTEHCQRLKSLRVKWETDK